MPIAAQRDEGLFRRDFAVWLARKLGVPDVSLSGLGGPAYSGFSNETILVDAAWTDGGERRTRGLAVRLEPSGHQVFPDTVFETQVDVIRALYEAGLTVPEILWYEPDSSAIGARFFVMTRVDGRAPTDNPPYHVDGWLHAVTPDVRGRIWRNGLDAMIAVHRTDRRGGKLSELPVISAADQLKRDREYLAWVLQGRSYPLVERAFDLLESKMPSDVEPALCWGDARIGNILFDDAGSVRAILDWEMVTIGDPLSDLAWFMLLDRHHSESCGAPRLEGFPSYEETITLWERGTDRSAAEYGWWELLGAAHYAAILTRVFDLLEDTGILEGARLMATQNTGTILLTAIMDEKKV
ncbi:MAG: phosphotransferase family protein [Actinomycetota bacterium]|nr:phosphotransferase family protein [Actinomycetota bacterium]